MKAGLQVLHIVLLLLVFILITIFKFHSSEGDFGRTEMDFTFYIVIGIWPVVGIIIALIRKVPLNSIPDEMIKIYRGLLQKMSFLYTSNGILLLLLGFLTYLFTAYREVAFKTNLAAVAVYVDENSSETDPLIGTATAEQPLKKRLATRKEPYSFILKYKGIEKPCFVDVKPFWQFKESIIVVIKF